MGVSTINARLTVILVGFLFIFTVGCSYSMDPSLKTIQDISHSNYQHHNSVKLVKTNAKGNADDFINPINFSYMKNMPIFPSKYLKNLPSYYDLRKLGRVTPVKDQDPLGTCWIFGSVASLESSLLPAKSWNLSENHIKNTLSYNYPHGFDRTYAGGGDWLAVLAYLTRYSGPVSAYRDPYNTKNGISPVGLKPILHVQGSIILPQRKNSLDNGQIKMAIKKYGGLVTAMMVTNNYYNKKTYGYYYNGKIKANHDICLVGWDDNYSRNNFLIKPPGNGAFIVKNSWGTGFGDKGYFYISYYDSQIADYGTCGFTYTTSPRNYNKVYQYDLYGLVNMIGFNRNTGWFSNSFKSASNDPLSATSFYALTPNTHYNVFVYINNKSKNPTSGKLVLSQSGTINTPGYKTIGLNHLVPLKKGQEFSVVVRLTTPGFNKPLGYEYPKSHYSSKASSHKGESFISPNGIKWMDMSDVVANSNICLKAFTVSRVKLHLNQRD